MSHVEKTVSQPNYIPTEIIPCQGRLVFHFPCGYAISATVSVFLIIINMELLRIGSFHGAGML